MRRFGFNRGQVLAESKPLVLDRARSVPNEPKLGYGPELVSDGLKDVSACKKDQVRPLFVSD